MKVYANLTGVIRETDQSTPLYTVEYIMLTGPKSSDSVGMDIGNYSNEIHLWLKLKQKLVEHLNVKYAPATFSMANVVLMGA